MLTSVAFGVGSLYNSWAHEKSCVLDRANVSPLLLTLNIQYTYLTICALHNKSFIDVFLHGGTANAALGASSLASSSTSLHSRLVSPSTTITSPPKSRPQRFGLLRKYIPANSRLVEDVDRSKRRGNAPQNNRHAPPIDLTSLDISVGEARINH